jgi:HPt (histidine-containing phosphotransfer) domain-containing protein
MSLDPSPLRRQLDGIPGLDVEAGLQTTAGRVESLARLLAKYADRHAESGRLVREAWEAGDRVSAHRLAHSIKGAAGFLGLGVIQARAADLEAALREPGAAPTAAPGIEGALAAFDQANAEACRALESLTEAGTPLG